jgi:membrane protease YdiL (CAAX protease family)
LKLWLFIAFLILWGNLLQPLLGASGVLPGGSWQFGLAGAALVVLSLLAARAFGLDAGALGLRGSDAARGALIGALAAGAIAATCVALLRLSPAIIGRPIVYEPLLRVTSPDLARHIALFLPLGAVLPEELAFRGTLLAELLRRGGTRLAVAGSAAVFALWHVAVAAVTVADTTLGSPSPLFAPAVAGTLVVLFVGGALMAVLRLLTGSLATTIAAHWVFNAVILVGLWMARSPQVPLAVGAT